MRPRHAPLVVVLLVALSVASGSPALAHGAHAPAATSYRTTITAVTPPIEGVSVRTIEATTALQVTNRTGRVVQVLGYHDEPYLEIRPDGVYENANSPATALNRDRIGDLASLGPAGPELAPDWRHVSSVPVARWYDHRTHWMSSVLPPMVVADPGSRHQLGTWAVRLRDADTIVEVTGTLEWLPAPAAWPWWSMTVLAAALVALAGLARAQRLPRTVAAVGLCGAGLVAIGYAAARELDAGASGPGELLAWLFTGQLLPLLCGLAALAAAGYQLARRPAPGGGNDLALVVTGGSLLLVAGLAEVAVFAHAVAPLPMAAAWARVAVALILATAAGAAAAVLVSQFRPRSGHARSRGL